MSKTNEEKKVKQEYLRKRFEIRWKNIEKKTNLVKRLNLPDKEILWQKVLTSYLNGFLCEYCSRKMLIKDSKYPYKKSFSLDHKISIFLGGDNSIENFAIVCHRCNIIKGTMKAETFKELLSYIPKNSILLDKMFKEIWDGRLADKLEREDKIKEGRFCEK